MKRKKKERQEEYLTGKTSDLRNVVAEIQKVDQETSNLTEVVEEARRIDRKVEKGSSLITYRLLFSSVYDKIFFALLWICFFIATFFVFRGNYFSTFYGFWIRVLIECGVLVLFVVFYYLLNWLYHCIIRTMMCVTKDQIYIEKYFPLWRWETSIPLEHITSISAVHFCFIFRFVIIFRQHAFPVVYFTWNCRKFKNKVMELLGKNSSVSNRYEDTSIITPKYYNFLKWFMIFFTLVIIILGIIHFFIYLFSSEKDVSGKYKNGKSTIELKMNGKCILNVNSVMKKVSCTWTYNKKEKEVELTLEEDKVTIPYKDDVVLYGGVKYKKK